MKGEVTLRPHVTEADIEAHGVDPQLGPGFVPVKGEPGAQGPRGVDLTAVRAYGDTLDDGQVMLSFSLPVPFGDEAKEAGRQLCRQMGLEQPAVYHAHDLGEGFTYLVVYARSPYAVDFTKISVPKVTSHRLDKHAVEHLAAEHFTRKLRVLGACTGDDAHTVGIDAILNVKGYSGEKGLEAYKCFEVRNMGAQVPNEVLLREAHEFQADAILVSQVVTQKDCHRTNLAALIDLAEAENLRSGIMFVAGGPRLSHTIALELGFDAGFGPGTLPPDVASFLIQALVARQTAAL
ncbi:MAG: OAM dimerization domain-containing protein [Myxococcota bacterium]